MEEIKRKDLYIISRCSNLSENTIQQVLDKKVYPDQHAWQKFIKILFLTFAVGFTVAGIIFFFAYNWDELNKFFKLAILQILIIGGIVFVLKSNTSLTVKNIILTGTSMLVGAPFAVFGQIYQTGANAYDFFLGWTIFISIWVIIANYASLWLLYSVLLNTTFYFYTEQVMQTSYFILVLMVFVLINFITLTGLKYISKRNTTFALPQWYYNILAIAISVFSTAILIFLEDLDNSLHIVFSILLVLGIYSTAIIYAKQQKNIFYIALICLSIICTIIYHISGNINDEIALLFMAIFSVVIFSLAIKLLLDLQKKWKNGK